MLAERLRELISEEWPRRAESPPTVDLALERPSLATDPDGPLGSSLSRALTRRGHEGSAPSGAAYWTDAGIFARHCDEVLLFGPCGQGAHESTEWVELSSVVETARVLYELALDYCAGSRS